MGLVDDFDFVDHLPDTGQSHCLLSQLLVIEARHRPTQVQDALVALTRDLSYRNVAMLVQACLGHLFYLAWLLGLCCRIQALKQHVSIALGDGRAFGPSIASAERVDAASEATSGEIVGACATKASGQFGRLWPVQKPAQAKLLKSKLSRIPKK
jgi:hypothetical protein